MKSSICFAIFLVVVQVCFEDYFYCGGVDSTKSETTKSKASKGSAQTVQGIKSIIKNTLEKKTKESESKDGPSQAVKGNKGDGKNTLKTRTKTESKDGPSQTVKKSESAAEEKTNATSDTENTQVNIVALTHVANELNDELMSNLKYQKFMRKIAKSKGLVCSKEFGEQDLPKILQSIDKGEITSLNVVKEQLTLVVQKFCDCIEKLKVKYKEKAKNEAFKVFKDHFISWAEKMLKKKSKSVKFAASPDEVIFIDAGYIESSTGEDSDYNLDSD